MKDVIIIIPGITVQSNQNDKLLTFPYLSPLTPSPPNTNTQARNDCLTTPCLPWTNKSNAK